MAILAILAIMAMMAILAIIFRNVGANKLLKGTQSKKCPLEGHCQRNNGYFLEECKNLTES